MYTYSPQRNRQCISLLLVLFLTLMPYSASAFAPEEIRSPETMTQQTVTGEEAATPHYVTGESLVAMLQNVVGFDIPGSSIVYNRRTGQIFVRNTPANQEAIISILEDLRQAMKRQVEIEARIISVSGVNFDGLGINTSSWKFASSDTGDFAVVSGDISSVHSTNPETRSSFPDLTRIFSTTEDTGAKFPIRVQKAGMLDLNATIDALGRKTRLNTLAAPRITVFNNQRANISIEKQQYYISRIESSFTGSAGSYTVAQNPDVAIARSGTILDVTPSINSNGTITLELHPNYVRVDLTNTQQIQKVAGVTPSSVTLPKYTSQEINTTVTIQNGGVVVLGGLISEEDINEHDKVPVLGSIPILGKLFFQSNQVRKEKTHLLMFVKATVKTSKA